MIWKRMLLLWMLVLVIGMPGPPALAQGSDADPAVLVVLDVSGSMARDGAEGTQLLDAAKQAVVDLVGSLPEEVDVGLRLYGHRVGNDESKQAQGCEDTELVVPVGEGTPATIEDALAPLESRGWTPIGTSLTAAGEDLGAAENATIVLVSDGEDTCTPPDPCEAARALTEEGVEVVVDTVGLLLDTDTAETQLSCIAEATGGQFVRADDAAALAEALEASASRAQRRYQATGESVAGAPIPFEAPTITPGTTYVDEIRGDEILFYEISGLGPGDAFDLEAVREQNPDYGGGVIGSYFGTYVSFVDRDDNDFGPASSTSGKELSEPQIIGLRDVTIPDEVDTAYLKIEGDAQNVDPNETQPVQFTVLAQDAAEATESPTPGATATLAPTATPTPTTTPTPMAAASPTQAAVPTDAGPSTPTWLLVLVVVLLLAVLALAAYVVKLQRSQAN